MAFVTFNPRGTINVIIDTISARKVLKLQMLWGESNNATHNVSPVKVDLFHCLIPCNIHSGVMISHLVLNRKENDRVYKIYTNH